MKNFISLLVVSCSIILSGCKEDSIGVQQSDRADKPNNELNPILKATCLNLAKPALQGDNLERLYRRAIFDFADYQVKNPPIGGRVLGRSLGQLSDMIWLHSDKGSEHIKLEPGQFAGVDFETPLGDLLSNAEPGGNGDLRPTVIGVYGISHSESKRRVQVVLGWIRTTGHSWTFLYDIDEQGVLLLRETVDHGGDFPDGWIDQPPYRYNSK
jgi:hypothetical protein